MLLSFTKQWYAERQNSHRIGHKKYQNKLSAIFGDLHKVERISTTFNVEVSYIDKFRKANYSLRFPNDIVNDFMKSTNDL